MGISFPKGGRQKSIVDVLFGKDGNVNTRMFSVCLAEEGGLLTVGGYDPKLHLPSATKGGPSNPAHEKGSEPIAWTTLQSSSSYAVHLSKIELEGEEIGSSPRDFGDAIVDSGTTYSYFPPAVFKKISAALKRVCVRSKDCREISGGGGLCWVAANANGEDLNSKLPSMLVHFQNGAQVEWKPTTYLYRRRNRSVSE
eukprot:GHVU01133728.1.p2 GENE.GHVU01133728.1~~GHVU01133728.1.p2  ORF type:complete len:197 (-),score=35.70 GHVU01133728.1:12-602(-)